MNLDKLYSLDLTKDEWREIICLVWLEHDFNLADRIQNMLLEKYQDINLDDIIYKGECD